jgi:hypothetical protein
MNFLRVAVLVSSVLLVLSSPIPQRNPEEEGNLFEGDIAGIVSELDITHWLNNRLQGV